MRVVDMRVGSMKLLEMRIHEHTSEVGRVTAAAWKLDAIR